jgi:hypothetical protein
MLARLSLAIMVSIVLIGPQTAKSGPITYDFTGTFSGNTAVNGSNQISGSFTINADPTVSPGATSVTESGIDVSITVNSGGYVYNFVSTPQNPTFATFTAVELQPNLAPNLTSQPLFEYRWFGVNPSLGHVFAMDFYNPGGASELLANVRNLKFNLDSSSFYFSSTLLGGPNQGGSGTITSITLVSAPEPSTLAAFAMLGIAMIARQRLKRQNN